MYAKNFEEQYPYKRLPARPLFSLCGRPVGCPAASSGPFGCLRGPCRGILKIPGILTLLSKNPGNFGNHPELKIPGILGIVRIEVWACRVGFKVPAQQ